MIVLLQLLLTALYVGYIWKRFGKLKSISTSTYYLEGPQRALFLGWLGSIGLLNLVHPMGMYGVLTMALLWFTGVTINHREETSFTKQVHSIATVGTIVVTYVGFIMLHGLWMPSVLLVASLPVIVYFDREDKVWWIEIVALGIAMASYLLL